jgi:hypothetical protein
MKKKIVTMLLLLVLLMLTVSCSYLQVPMNDKQDIDQRSDNFPIIDMHMHTFQWNKYGDPPQPNLITGNVPAPRSNTEAVEAYLAEMDRYNIVLAVGSGELEMVELMESYAQDRFLGGIEFPKYTTPVNNRMEEWPDVDEMRSLFETDQLQIMGEITAMYAGVAPTDSILEPYFALAEELDIPVSFHTGFGPPMSPYMGDPNFRMRYGKPLLLEDVLVKHPNLRIYIAHGGYPFIDETIALMLMYQQVYVDISMINWTLTPEEFNSYLERMIDARLGDRILFGTDQMIWPETVGMAIKAVENAPCLSEEQKQDIFFYNAATFLRLDTNQYLPGSGETIDDSGARVIKVFDDELRMRPAEVGDQKTIRTNLELSGVTSTAIQVTFFDIDGITEAQLLINGQNVDLSGQDIVADMAPKTVTIELEEGLLVEGENMISFVFADAVGETTGFSILDTHIILRQ